MALRMVLWQDEWPEGAKQWSFDSIEHQDLRRRGYAPVEDLRTFSHPQTKTAAFRRWHSENEHRSCWVTEAPDALMNNPPGSGGHGGFCDTCKQAFPPLRQTAEEFFTIGSYTCTHCQVAFDLWEKMVRDATEWDGEVLNLTAIGAYSTPLRFELSPGETKTIDLKQHLRPEAVILDVNFTPYGLGVDPIIVHGNTVPRTFGNPMIVYGRPLGDPQPDPLDISTNITWIFDHGDRETWTRLAEAFDAWKLRKWGQTITAAASLVEIALGRLVRAALPSEQQTNAKALVQKHLPRLAADTGMTLPPNLCQALDELRELRNRIMHEALADEALSQPNVARLLYASAFGVEFVRQAQWKLLGAGRIQQPVL
jgi:hypothetical protein